MTTDWPARARNLVTRHSHMVVNGEPQIDSLEKLIDDVADALREAAAGREQCPCCEELDCNCDFTLNDWSTGVVAPDGAQEHAWGEVCTEHGRVVPTSSALAANAATREAWLAGWKARNDQVPHPASGIDDVAAAGRDAWLAKIEPEVNLAQRLLDEIRFTPQALKALQALNRAFGWSTRPPTDVQAANDVTREAAKVVAAFVAPENSKWQGVVVNVTEDGAWWTWRDDKWNRDWPPLPNTVDSALAAPKEAKPGDYALPGWPCTLCGSHGPFHESDQCPDDSDERNKAWLMRDALQAAMEWAAKYPLGGDMDAKAASHVYNLCDSALAASGEAVQPSSAITDKDAASSAGAPVEGRCCAGPVTVSPAKPSPRVWERRRKVNK